MKQEKAFEKKSEVAASVESGGEERRENRWGKREIEIRTVTLRSLQGQAKHVFSPDEGMIIEMDVAAPSAAVKDFVFGIGIFNSQGVSCYGTNTHLEDWSRSGSAARARSTSGSEKLNLINGTYYLDVAVHRRDGYPVRLSPEPVFVPRLLDRSRTSASPACRTSGPSAGTSRSGSRTRNSRERPQDQEPSRASSRPEGAQEEGQDGRVHERLFRPPARRAHPALPQGPGAGGRPHRRPEHGRLDPQAQGA